MYDFTCVDFETANNNMNSACSVGLVSVVGTQIVKREYFLIKPPGEHFRHENIEIHGITPEKVMNSPSFSEVWKEIEHYFADSEYIIAHNAYFDMSVLYQSLDTYGIEHPNFLYIDSMSLCAKVKNEGSASLADCAAFFGIPMEHHHNALEDAVVCAEIVIRSINNSRYSSLEKYLKGYYSLEKKIKSFSELKPKKVFKSSGFSNVKISELSAATAEFDSSHPLYQKICVLTGELESLSRKDAMQKILDAGGVIKNGVTSKTNYLIVGKQDKKLVGADGLSTKEEKAYDLIKAGKNIAIINENEFLSLLEK